VGGSGSGGIQGGGPGRKQGAAWALGTEPPAHRGWTGGRCRGVRTPQPGPRAPPVPVQSLATGPSARVASARTMRRAFWTARWPSTLSHHSSRAWAFPPWPPRPMVMDRDTQGDGRVGVGGAAPQHRLPALEGDGTAMARCTTSVVGSRTPAGRSPTISMSTVRASPRRRRAFCSSSPAAWRTGRWRRSPQGLRIHGAHVHLEPGLERDGVHRGAPTDAPDVETGAGTGPGEGVGLLHEVGMAWAMAWWGFPSPKAPQEWPPGPWKVTR
jgi:hypothetical protein